MVHSEKDMTQAGLARLVGCTNNYISRIEVAQTRVSLGVLIRIADALEKDLDYFLLDTPYVNRERLIEHEISAKLKQCNTSTLVVVCKILDTLLEYQHTTQHRAERTNLSRRTSPRQRYRPKVRMIQTVRGIR